MGRILDRKYLYWPIVINSLLIGSGLLLVVYQLVTHIFLPLPPFPSFIYLFAVGALFPVYFLANLAIAPLFGSRRAAAYCGRLDVFLGAIIIVVLLWNIEIKELLERDSLFIEAVGIFFISLGTAILRSVNAPVLGEPHNVEIFNISMTLWDPFRIDDLEELDD